VQEVAKNCNYELDISLTWSSKHVTHPRCQRCPIV
jgi:hypothetical protein